VTDVDYLLARLELSDAMARYCRGVDRGDEALMASIFHDDADVSHGLHTRTHADDSAYDDFTFFHHHVANQVVEIAGDVAATETYLIAAQGFRRDGVDYEMHVKARYLDRWERRGGPFRVAYRRVVWDWVRTEPASPTWPDGAYIHWAGNAVSREQLRWGTRSGDDESYALFRSIRHCGDA
jgi:hypothetical protein